MLLDKQEEGARKIITHCPYCQSPEVVKKGIRKKKLEEIQVYFCKHCEKKFTPVINRGKTYPLRVILEAVTLFNRLFTLEEIGKKIEEKYGFKLAPQTVTNWINHYNDYLPVGRMRDFFNLKYKRKDLIEEVHMLHGQIYDYKFHRAKMDCVLESEFKHYKLKPLREFLELCAHECPHQIFKDSQKRASEIKNVFNLDEVRFRSKSNTANRVARFVMQAVANNKLRHEVLQEFMLVNDSVTVAVEVPILLDQDDIIHFQNELAWKVPLKINEGEVITGHIDIVQVRNGVVHLLDYKPSAKKVKPIEQLTLYALAMSRLTSLRLFNFKCAWFDEDDYYEFFPLHVVMKKKKKLKLKKSEYELLQKAV